MVECKNCGTTPAHVQLVRYWTEYRVGGVDSADRFHLCPDCEDVDPRQMLSVNHVTLEA